MTYEQRDAERDGRQEQDQKQDQEGARSKQPPEHGPPRLADLHSESPCDRGVQAAKKFIGRVSQLDLGAVQDAVRIWHDMMRVDTSGWFAVERAIGQAVIAAGLETRQEALLIHVAECFVRRVWAQDGAAELRVGTTEASGQYLATVAMLALLVREHVSPDTFAIAYRPFATAIPADELDPE